MKTKREEALLKAEERAKEELKERDERKRANEKLAIQEMMKVCTMYLCVLSYDLPIQY